MDGKKIVLHLIPSGILRPDCISIVGHGVVFDPESFCEELAQVRNFVKVDGQNLKISAQCSVITAYDKLLDACREKNAETMIGTTKRGIGPAYENKISRQGLKLKDLFHLQTLTDRLAQILSEREVLFKHLYKTPYPSLKEETERLFKLGEAVGPFMTDTFSLLEEKIKQGKKILYEGAQGILLDIDYGSYPYVTSSSTALGGIYTGAGCPGHHVEEVLGVAKAYTTRVGVGPFPTELKDATGEWLQTKGNEFGATTGRRRRCGWLDLPLLKYAKNVSGLTGLVLTKADVLIGMEKIQVCYAYEYEGKVLDSFSPNIDLNRVKPLYQTFSGFSEIGDEKNLNPHLQKYVSFIEEKVGIPVGMIAFGPERKELILRKNYF